LVEAPWVGYGGGNVLRNWVPFDHALALVGSTEFHAVSV